MKKKTSFFLSFYSTQPGDEATNAPHLFLGSQKTLHGFPVLHKLLFVEILCLGSVLGTSSHVLSGYGEFFLGGGEL